MKDIANYKLVHVQTALQRLDQALTKLESAAAQVPVAKESSAHDATLAQKLEALTRAHGALKDSAGKIATKLDAAIGRLSASLQD